MTYEDVNTNLTEQLSGLNAITCKTPSMVHDVWDSLKK